MSSELRNSRLGHAKRDGMLTHKREIKVSSKEVTAATNAPRTPRIRSDPSLLLLTPKEAAHYLRVSLSWLAKARMHGDGPPFIPIGRRAIRYPEPALIHWIKGRQRLSTSEQR